MTLRGGQGQWKWHDQVKLNELCHHARFHIHHIYNVQEDTALNFLIGEMLRWLAGQPETDHYAFVLFFFGIVSNIPKTWNFQGMLVILAFP